MKYEELRTIKEYAKLCVKKGKTKLNENDWKEIAANVYGEKLKPLHYMRCRKVINTPDIKKIAELRIIELLDKQGMGEDYALTLLKDAEKIAKDKGEANNLIKIADIMLDLRQHKPSKVKVTESRTYNNADLGNIDKTISDAQADKRKVTVTTTLTQPNDVMESTNRDNN